jgi:hypothetical protein
MDVSRANPLNSIVTRYKEIGLRDRPSSYDPSVRFTRKVSFVSSLRRWKSGKRDFPTLTRTLSTLRELSSSVI